MTSSDPAADFEEYDAGQEKNSCLWHQRLKKQAEAYREKEFIKDEVNEI